MTGRLGDLIDARPQPGREREMLLPGFGEPPDRQQLVLRLQLVGHVGDGQPGRVQLQRIEHHFDFARVAGQHLDLARRPGTRASAGRMT